MTKSAPLRVAIVQQPPVFLNLEASLARAETLVAEAARADAKLVAFPETWLPGYPVWLDEAPDAARWDHPGAKALYQLLAEQSLQIPGPHVDRLRALAARYRVDLVMGAHERRGGTLYNVMLFLSADGERHALHRKLTPTYTERLIWGQGDGSTLATLDTDHGTLGGLICWEHWMPLARAAMHAKHEVVHVAQWPAVGELHQLASRTYAFEGQCFVLAAGCVLSKADVLDGLASLSQTSGPAFEMLASMPGDAGHLYKNGGSAIIAPDARYLVPPSHEAAILHADLDPSLVTQGHLVLDTAGHYARPDVFQLSVDTRSKEGVTYTA
ncbi:carbon-nitrogen hydrolase family protein [Geothrix sp. PMB-07]|uniref:carbon-nitrogen hydrolase family protein n=1 Tax=Geothrix sp. PMB-07 TaxID=3068640 RepID=UPI00274220FC|nr:carbon-nitrogen hydrolase family protein [Geothrix sp. PMB-07]WLT30260.1 carbon-nitrogen hydrolase family protein [Geothrix sp. PMB-07]